tara:strand:+ start:421 stop:696 length:276 start_codon:yes stop_codon:yes gene_type:complete
MIECAMRYVRYYLIFVTLELLVIFMTGCSAPRERRGDWMEHLNYKQFNFDAPMIHWDRHNYYSEEELRDMWNQKYAEVKVKLEDKNETVPN